MIKNNFRNLDSKNLYKNKITLKLIKPFRKGRYIITFEFLLNCMNSSLSCIKPKLRLKKKVQVYSDILI